MVKNLSRPTGLRLTALNFLTVEVLIFAQNHSLSGFVCDMAENAISPDRRHHGSVYSDPIV